MTYSLRVKLILAVCENGGRRTMWLCALSPVRTCLRRCYPCVVCGSPKSPRAALWQEARAPGRGYPVASLASAAREERKTMSMHCCGDVNIISSSSDLLAVEQRNHGMQDNLTKSISVTTRSFTMLMSLKASETVLALWHYKTKQTDISLLI